MKFYEPTIVINGKQLNEAQASVVRVAITHFHNETNDDEMKEMLGDLAQLYHNRLNEVLFLIGMPKALL